jgi:hypothetical protein
MDTCGSRQGIIMGFMSMIMNDARFEVLTAVVLKFQVF